MTGSDYKIWEQALSRLSDKISSNTYENMCEQVEPGSISGGVLTLNVPYKFIARQILPTEKVIIESIISEIVGERVSINIRVRNRNESVSTAKLAIKAQTTITNRKNLVKNLRGIEGDEKINGDLPDGGHVKRPVQSREFDNRSLKPSYVFENFVVGGNSLMAHAASLAVAKEPGEVYNPLFIYGGVGLGKTHLLHAIGHHVRKNYPHMIIRLCPAELYVHELIEAIHDKERSRQFRAKYRRPDILLIDDIHFLIDKDATQEAFFHTFNFLYESNKQIVITCDRHPRELRTLKERLINRFQLGLLVDIQRPSYETRLAILKMKAGQMEMKVPIEILEFFANEVQGSIRSLEGCLKAVLSRESSLNQRISLEDATRIVRDYANDQDSDRNLITLKKILDLVCHHYRVSYEDLASPSREGHLTHPRHIGMYLARKYTSHSLKEIARVFKRKDHGTVYHGVKKISGNINIDAVLAREINYIEDLLLGKAPVE
ncbi:MAG: chromosomal replication initiator protein DnaA [bacterium]